MNIEEVSSQAINLINSRGYIFEEEGIFGEYIRVELEECLHIFPKSQIPTQGELILGAGSFPYIDMELTCYALIHEEKRMIMLAIVNEVGQGQYWNAYTYTWEEIITEGEEG